MKKIASWLFATLGGIVLLFSYKTSTEAVQPTTLPAAPAAQQPAASPQGASPAGGQAQAPSSGLKDGTYTGARVDTPYGPVQVQVTVAGGAVTGATAVDYPNASGRDQAINGYAIPRLQSESAGTSDGRIDMVTGATYTSDGYIGSLQDALDQAH